MKFSYSPWLSALTVATTAATVTMVNVSPATAASMKYDLRINGIDVVSPALGGSTTINNVDIGYFTTNDSMDAIESVSLEMGDFLFFDQGEFENNGSQILFSNSAQPTQSVTLFDILSLPQESGGMVTGGATLINGDFSDSLSYKVTNNTPVPEPLTLLGSAAALGFGVGLKQEHSRRKNKVNK
ncbi:MAG: PEP-CTERM sorting domain-containing protein [Coleofasciculus sp. B1-GNL1-01]|uniref:PEP-CTERM sorting domain-containing protein n=1 Tax=Coleofasciculus sp. B1-GNL1-01 TaxID=3068484 RepID=UPI003301CCD4